MIPITQLDPSLSLYHSAPVILWGEGEVCQKLAHLLEARGVTIACHWGREPISGEKIAQWRCTLPRAENLENPNNPENPKTWEGEIPGEQAPSATKVILQLGETGNQLKGEGIGDLGGELPDIANLEEKDLLEHGVKLVTFTETWEVLQFYQELEDYWNTQGALPLSQEESQVQQQVELLREGLETTEFLLQSHQKPPVLLCMPPKTGDHTLMDTFSAYGVPHRFLFHTPGGIDRELCQLLPHPVKVMVGVRDPIAQHISLLYQVLGEISTSPTAKVLAFGRNPREIFAQGGDAQQWFHWMIEGLKGGDPYGINDVEAFFRGFQQWVGEVMSQPFPQEQGYSVVELGNIQVFLYQLERLDRLLPAISDFVGQDLPEFHRSNLAKEKWIAPSYDQALQELRFTQDYWEKVWAMPWVRHFYSQEQIASFQKRWQSQVE